METFFNSNTVGNYETDYSLTASLEVLACRSVDYFFIDINTRLVLSSSSVSFISRDLFRVYENVNSFRSSQIVIATIGPWKFDELFI